MKYFNLWGLLTFYLYKDNAILFMKGCVASLLFSPLAVMGCNGKGSDWKRWDHSVHLKTWAAEKVDAMFPCHK